MPPNCPESHTPLGEVPITIHDQSQIDLPEPKPLVTRFRVPADLCPACLRRVQGRHPEHSPQNLTPLRRESPASFPPTDVRLTPTLIGSAMVAALGGLLFGFDTAVIVDRGGLRRLSVDSVDDA
jgi:hypothetical protein